MGRSGEGAQRSQFPVGAASRGTKAHSSVGTRRLGRGKCKAAAEKNWSCRGLTSRGTELEKGKETMLRSGESRRRLEGKAEC